MIPFLHKPPRNQKIIKRPEKIKKQKKREKEEKKEKRNK